SLKAAISNGCMTGLVSSRKRTFGHLAHMNSASLSGAFADVGDAFEMQREPQHGLPLNTC
ncbi:TPA: hypothetical protein ACG2VV_004990, partial [Escherichia coli]